MLQLISTVTVLMAARVTASQSVAPPNIMLVVADDLGFNDVDFQVREHTFLMCAGAWTWACMYF